ncbi:hypothetical protein F52700_5945 [Fusarium sp. NRRL 52700]|nr:hypothetical protein F52700_5945 [Fusarium sp. NRRL 52700]
MRLLHFLLFMLNLARATPVALEDSSLDSFLNSEDEGSVRVADDPNFFDLGNGNTKTPKRHNKRTGPPYLLEYTKWKITLERRKGDARDFKRPGWLIGFREPSVHWGIPEGHGTPWEFVITPGGYAPEIVRNVWDGDMFYTTNSYFNLFINGKKPLPTRRTYTAYTEFSTWERQGYKFEIIRTENDKLARENRDAWFSLPDKRSIQPTSGYIAIAFRHDFSGEVNLSDGFITYEANITGEFIQTGEMLV